MAPGLSLLVQGVLEFVPVMVGLVQKRHENSQSHWKLHSLGDLQDVVQCLGALVESTPSETSFEQVKQQQQQLARYGRETQLKLAAYQRETALKLPETHKILDHWPLTLYPSQILASHSPHGPLPLRIFLAFPGDRLSSTQDPSLDVASRLAQGIRTFLSEHYPLHSPTRPTEFLAGAWESQRFHSEASIKALFGLLKSEPTLILESELDGQTLNFRIAYWGPGQEAYYYKTIAQLPYQTLLNDAAKARALHWKTVHDRLLALGEDPDTVNRLGGTRIANLELLEKEAQWSAQGIDVEQLQLRYQVDSEVLDEVAQRLIRYHCLVAAWVADTYHLVYRDVAPLLPALLPELTQDGIDESLLRAIATGYQQIYQALEQERQGWVPELALQLAQSLSHLPDKSWANAQIDVSLTAWLQWRQVAVAPGDSALTRLLSIATSHDCDYLEQLKTCFDALGETGTVAQLERLLDTLRPVPLTQKKLGSSPAFIHGVCVPIKTLTDQSGKIALVSTPSDEEILVSAGLDQTLQVWNVSTGEPLYNLKGHGTDISSVAVSPDGQFLATSSLHCSKSNVKIWNLQTGKLLRAHLGHKKSVRLVAMDRLGRLMSCKGDKIKIWDVKTGDRLGTLSHPGSVNAIAVSANGQVLATGNTDSKIRLWDLKTGEPQQTLKGHTAAVNALIFGPDGNTLISASADQTIRIWHLATGALIHTLSGHAAAVNAIAVHHAEQLLISGSADTTLKFWKLDSWELLHTVSDQTSAIHAIALSKNGHFLASASTDQTVKIWQL